VRLRPDEVNQANRTTQTLNVRADTETTMKTPSISTHLSSLITTAIFGALALGCSAVSTAAERGDLPQVLVRFEDLNLATRQGASALYGRIAAAADEVCQSNAVDNRDLLAQQQLRACVHKAIADAVTKVGQPELLAIYNAKNHRPVATMVAIAQNR
jgi:UrcA family protein